MALQIRRGLEADLPASPADGELLYATDTNKLYVGDGGVPQEISGGGGGGGISNLVEDTTPQLGGNLDVNGQSIVSTSNGDITISPNGTGHIVLNGDVTKTGTLSISPSAGVRFGESDGSVNGSITIVSHNTPGFGSSGFTFRSHHGGVTTDTYNMYFYRTRGTGLSPLPVLQGDEIADMVFAAYDGTSAVSAAILNVVVDSPISTGSVPGKFVFSTHNGTSLASRAELSPTGVWKVNEVQNYSGSSLTLTATTVDVAGNMQLNAQSDLRFADADSTNYVGFQAPTTVASNVVWTLPATDGGAGQVLSTNGSGVLSWATTSSGSGLTSRSTASATTASIADGAIGNISITGFKGYILYKVEVDGAAWVRIYTDEASRTADASRVEGVDPLPGAGVITEVITTGSQTILISPGAFGFNNEASPTTAIPIAVTNKTGSTTTITVTLTIVQLEA